MGSGDPIDDKDRGRSMKILLRIGLTALALVGFSAIASSAPLEVIGPDACKKCHTAEHEVYLGTPHYKSFKTVHKEKVAKTILKAIGEKRMKKSETCGTCHYSYIDGKAKAGPTCESCHGPAQEWLKVHNDKTNPNRMADAAAKGMLQPSMLFDVASNCMGCHGLANPALPGDTAATMLANGHPLNPAFELVEYSQGTVRHRFYPPNVKENQELTPAELSVYYLVGQAAALVSATEAISKTDDAKYAEAQKARIAKATEVLGGISEAGALLGAPTRENGRAFGEAIKGKDFTAQVGGNLPKSYK